ncbi:MAG: hypothetical protein NT069_24365, partial [Planctomycetota bacterium]|nr:hypothetical protein [Planctomycetota bacterium]
RDAAGASSRQCGGRRSYDAAVSTSSAESSGDRLQRRIGNACSHDVDVKQRVTVTDPAAGCAVGRDAAGASSRQRTCGGRRSYDAAVWTSSAESSGDRLQRRIGNACSHDVNVKQRVTVTDLTAGCAVGRDAAGASSRQKRRRRDMSDSPTRRADATTLVRLYHSSFRVNSGIRLERQRHPVVPGTAILVCFTDFDNLESHQCRLNCVPRRE